MKGEIQAAPATILDVGREVQKRKKKKKRSLKGERKRRCKGGSECGRRRFQYLL